VFARLYLPARAVTDATQVEASTRSAENLAADVEAGAGGAS
jgi:hypothetical protein